MVTYKIFQIKPYMISKFGYKALKYGEVTKEQIDLTNYEEVYCSVIEKNDGTLEELFEIFNLRHPRAYFGRSMSVSDIVLLDGEYYYCDSVGWENVTDVVRKRIA